MTGPSLWDQQYGINSAIAQREQAEFDRARQAAVAAALQDLGMMQGLSGRPAGGGGYPGFQTPPVYATGVPSMPVVPQAHLGAVDWRGLPDTELLGQAKFWGIPDDVARHMPRAELEEIIKQYRQHAWQTQDSLMGDAASIASGLVARGGLGVAQSVTGGLKRLPGVGEWFAKTETLQSVDRWLNELEEGVRATMPERSQWAGGTAEVAGQIAGMIYPGVGAWKLAGAAGRFVPWGGRVTSPIVRAAAQGGSAAYLLEGGSEHPALAVGLGTVLGGAEGWVVQRYGPSLAEAAKRVAAKFRRGGEHLGPARPGALLFLKPRPPADDFEATMLRIVNDPQADRDQWAQAYAFLNTRGSTPVAPPLPRQQRFVPGGDPFEDTMRAVLNDPASTPEQIEQAVAMLSARGAAPVDDFARMTIGGPDLPAGYDPMPDAGPYAPDDFVRSPMGREPVPTDRSPYEPDDFVRMPYREGPPPPTPSVIPGAPDIPPEVADELGSAITGLRPTLPERPRIVSRGGMSLDEASADAIAINKAATVIESPQLGRAAGMVEPDDVVVAQAAVNTNPGGTSVVAGVVDPPAFMASLIPDLPEGYGVRLATRPGDRTPTAIISDQPITDDMVREYESYGFYSGQRVVSASGREGIIVGFEGGKAILRQPNRNLTYRARLEGLSGASSSPGTREVPGLWDAFKQYADGRTVATGEAMGGALTPERLDALRTANMPQYIDDFLDEHGITAVGERARIKEYFNDQYVAEHVALAPEEEALQQAIQAQLDAVEDAIPQTPIARMDDVAASKGFVVIPHGSDGSWSIVDLINPGAPTVAPTEIRFSTREAAEEWITRMQRELPDVTPPGDVPFEIAAASPRASTQEPRLANTRQEEALVENIEELIDDIEADAGGAAPPGTGDHLRAMLGDAAGKGPAALARVWDYAFSQFQPMRARFMELDRRLAQAGLPLNIWGDWDTLSTQMVKNHNWQNRWHDQWARIMAQFDDAQLSTGKVVELYELEDDALRVARAREAGFSPRQIAALEEMHGFFREIFPDTGLDPAREIKRYISHVKKRQAYAGSEQAFDEFTLNPVVTPFHEMARTGNLQMREMDARMLGTIYIRSVGFSRHMRSDWEAITRKWNGIKEIPELKPVADIMANWMHMVRYGYAPGIDRGLKAVHSVMQAFVPGITPAQTRTIFNHGISSTHSALLGFRPDVWMRDSIQIFLALPRAGRTLIDTMMRYSGLDDTAKAAMWDRGIRHGWVNLGMPRTAQPGLFEQAPLALPGEVAPGSYDEFASGAAPGGTYKFLQTAGAFLRDISPTWMRNIQGTPLHPLYLYTKLGERMRLFVGEAGYQKAGQALRSFREHGDFARLEGESAARTFDPAVRAKFRDLVSAGNDEEAAAFLGRQLADATQFRYGGVEGPEAARPVFGKLGAQMGSFTLNLWQYAKESLKNGTKEDRAKFLAMWGASALALELGKKATGWDFSKWHFHNSLTFMGGPWLSAFADAQAGASAAARLAAGQDNAMLQQQADRLATFGATVGNALNPTAGLIRTVGGIQQAQNAPNPQGFVESLARLFTTGERGAGMSWGDWVREQLTGGGTQQPQMVPYSSPMRGSATGTAQPSARPDPLPPAVDGVTIPPEVLRLYGVTDPSRVYVKNGQWVYDSQNKDPNGQVPTHAIAQGLDLLRPGQTWEQYEQEVVARRQQGAGAFNVVRDISRLDIEMQPRVYTLMAMAQEAGISLEVAETVRPQQRQEAIFAQGRGGNSGSIASWTLTSGHRQGRAIDFIVNGDYSGRDPGYRWLQKAAQEVGLVPFSLDPSNQADPGHIYGTDSSFAAPSPRYTQPQRVTGAQW